MTRQATNQTLIKTVLCLLVPVSYICCSSVWASGSLLDSSLQNANTHDFVSYFGFAQNNVVNRPDGLIDHSYYSKTWTCFLVLSVDKTGRVVHLKLGVPRPLIDDENVCTRGRDIVKSFVLASAVGQDVPVFKNLADEIYVRGLDLQPIKSHEKSKTIPTMQAYKIGKGPVTNGDNAIFLSSFPKLQPQPSSLFLVVLGKSNSAAQDYQNCRLAFNNEKLNGAKSALPLLWCEAWDEALFKARFARRN